MTFRSPGWLVLLAAVLGLAVGYVWLQRRRRAAVAAFSNPSLMGSLAPVQPSWRRHVTFVLLLAALAVLTVGVARPNASVRVPRETATIMLSIDVSLSMGATDVLPTRIAAAQKAADEFADLLPPKINLGLVAFAGSASVKVAPTTDRLSFKTAIAQLKLADSTAIGGAVIASLNAIKTFSLTTTSSDQKPAPARIVLLSDGTNNIGPTINTAATAAKSANIKVSTISFGTANGTITDNGQTIAVPVGTTDLQALATATGGTFNTAVSSEQLTGIYKNIGSQIGYTRERRDISWRFLIAGLVLALGSAGTSLFWRGRLS